MPIFDPPELEQTLADAVHKFRAVLGEQSDSLFDDTVYPREWDTADSRDESMVIAPGTILAICLPYCSAVERTCAEFLDFVPDLPSAEIDHNLFCWTKKRLLLRMAPIEGHEERLFSDILELDLDGDDICDGEYFPIEISVGTQTVRCSIRSGLSAFGVLIAAGDDYDKYLPPLLPYELFIEVCFKEALDRELAANVANAYLFEISTSLQVELVPDSRPVRFGDTDERGNPPAADRVRFRPLMIGKGIGEILHLYHEAIKTLDPEIRVLQFYRVFEHVSGTVVHKNLVENARAKLTSTSALDPDAGFVMELKSVFDLHRGFSKDREAIKLTFRTCCEPTELLKVAPECLKESLALAPTAKTREREDALDTVGVCLVATRNFLAHSKVNYEPKGEECPAEQLAQFVECMKVAAQQIIRWYHNQPEKLRIS